MKTIDPTPSRPERVCERSVLISAPDVRGCGRTVAGSGG
jgi:hypothetical protein